jgi:hypothetical protein
MYLGLLLLAAASTLTPTQLLANPSTYDGQSVTVAGKVSHYQTQKVMMRTIAGFQLCDTQCVVVIDETNGQHANGDQTSVSGTFYKTFKGRSRTFNNCVVIK